MIDVDQLYRDLTGSAPDSGLTRNVRPQNFHGFKIPDGATATYRPEGRGFDVLVKYHGNTIGINAEGHRLMTDVGSNAPDNISDLVQKAIEPYAS